MKTKVLAGLVVLTLIAVAAVKVWVFPSVKDAYFALDERSLQTAPAGFMVVRQTHFAYLRDKGVLRIVAQRSKGKDQWMMGRNAPLADVMAAAYGRNPTRVVVPPDAPPDRFDFLMTVPAAQLPRFQAIVRRKLGYVGQMETRDAPVLALKIANASLPGLTVSGADEKRNVSFHNEKLQLTHFPLAVIPNGFGGAIDMPLVDKTGLTNFYNFSIAWDSLTQQRLEDKTAARDALNKIINPLGLNLEPDTAPLEMLVVKKAD
jgi:uncharacterized protein (TIGR03435 family)